jgi:hypothetical protein
VNYKVKVPGFAEPFLSKDMRFDPEANILCIKAPNVTPFYADDDIWIEVLDLEVPVAMRHGLANGGWVDLAMWEFIALLRHTYMLED